MGYETQNRPDTEDYLMMIIEYALSVISLVVYYLNDAVILVVCTNPKLIIKAKLDHELADNSSKFSPLIDKNTLG